MWIKGSGGDIGTLKKADWQHFMWNACAVLKTFIAVWNMKMNGGAV